MRQNVIERVTKGPATPAFPLPKSRIVSGMSQWSEELVSRFARSVRRRRQQLGLTAQEVADRTTELGHPIGRSAIAAWENDGRGDRLMMGDALVLAEVLRIPLGSLLYPEQPDGEVEAYPGVVLKSYTAAQSLGGTGLPLGKDDLAPAEDGTGSNLKGERAGEIITGYEVSTTAKDLMQAREDLREAREGFDAALERGDIDVTNTYRRRVDSLQRLVDMYAAYVRKHGGVVHDE